MKAVHADSRQELSSLEAELGPCILKDKPDLWLEFVKGKAEHYRRLLQQMEISAAAMNSDKYKNLKNLLSQVDGLINKSV
jgi:tRNA (adenine22-N1)-methyltransferase